jgi:hypothetical protein
MENYTDRNFMIFKFGGLKTLPYICITIERGNDLDTTFNCFYKFYKNN